MTLSLPRLFTKEFWKKVAHCCKFPTLPAPPHRGSGIHLKRNIPINELDLTHFECAVAELFKWKHPCEGWFNSASILSMGQDQNQAFSFSPPFDSVLCCTDSSESNYLLRVQCPRGDRVGGRGRGFTEMESTPVPLTLDAQWIWKVMWCFLAIDSIGLDSAT